MTALTSSTAKARDRELIITRIFDAPQKVVFDAWTRPDHLAGWFGPSGFTLPFCEVDFRVGGSYRFCMRSPEGEDHWVWGEYTEIEEPVRLAFTWKRGNDFRGELWSTTTVELTFVERQGGTELSLRQGIFETVPYYEEHSIGWSQCLDRLVAYVESAEAITTGEESL